MEVFIWGKCGVWGWPVPIPHQQPLTKGLSKEAMSPLTPRGCEEDPTLPLGHRHPVLNTAPPPRNADLDMLPRSSPRELQAQRNGTRKEWGQLATRGPGRGGKQASFSIRKAHKTSHPSLFPQND